MCVRRMDRTKTLDLFVTDTDYDKDQTPIGVVSTVGASLTVTADAAAIEALKQASNAGRRQVVVRFISATMITDYITVRAVADTTFTVEVAVELVAATGPWSCVLVRPWGERALNLTSRFQHVIGVEILAYTLVGLSTLSLWEDEDTGKPPSIDFVGLEIKELPGRTLSTNRYMQNTLAVLPTHVSAYHPSSWTEAKDAMIFVPQGMMKTVYDEPLPAVNSITPKLIDRRGDSVGATRFHVWLRLTVVDR